MSNLIKSDVYKLLKSVSLWIVFILSCVGAFIMLMSSHLVSTGDMSMQTASSLPAFFVDSQMITLLGCVMVGISLCSDFENKVISNAVSNGYGRNLVVISKVIVLFMVIVFLLLPYIISVIILAFTDISFVAFIETPLLKTLTSCAVQERIGFFNIMKVIISIILIYFSQLCICIPIMFIFKKPVITLAFSYISILLLGPIAKFNESISKDVTMKDFTKSHLYTFLRAPLSESASLSEFVKGLGTASNTTIPWTIQVNTKGRTQLAANQGKIGNTLPNVYIEDQLASEATLKSIQITTHFKYPVSFDNTNTSNMPASGNFLLTDKFTNKPQTTEADLNAYKAGLNRYEYGIYTDSSTGISTFVAYIGNVDQTHGTGFTAPKVSASAGYVFEGWYTDETYKTKYDFEASVTSDIVLHAKWKKTTTTTTPNVDKGNESSKGKGQNSPKTGDNRLAIWFVVLLIGSGAIVLSKKKVK